MKMGSQPQRSTAEYIFRGLTIRKITFWKKISAIGPFKNVMPDKNFIIEELGSKQRFQLLYLS